ncbi:Guanosine-diphosphatase [Thecaphora frezii]
MSYARVPTTEADDQDYEQQQQQHHHHHHHQESPQQQQRSPPPRRHYKARSISRASLDLSRSEAGSFLGQSNLDLDDVSYPPPHRSATASGSSKLTMPLGTKRLVFFLLTAACLIWLLGPAQRRQDVTSYVNDKAGQVLDKTPWRRPNLDVANDATDMPGIARPPPPATSPSPTAANMASTRERPQLHPDPLKTTRCDEATRQAKPLDIKGNVRPLIQYAIMIDAGSTGSRVHVYKFNYCNKAPELEDEYFNLVIGGLSNYGTNPPAAADSLRPLLKDALERVPKELHSCTPIAVKATAGLRLLPGQQAQDVLAAVRQMLETEYPFPIADGRDSRGQTGTKGVEIMEGREEGVFAWITVNYLLNRIGNSEGAEVETAAVMDLGGGSTQIVFEPAFTTPSQGMHPGEHVYNLKDFGARSFTLYQNSYLGYGLMQARQSVNSLAAFAHSLTHPDAVRTGSAHSGAGVSTGAFSWSSMTPENTRIPSPCFANNATKTATITQPGSTDKATVTFIGTEGGFTACKRLVEVMMDKDAVCKARPCSFGGVYQPSLMETFRTAPIIALSYFYDRLAPFGVHDEFSIDELARLAEKVCSYSAESLRDGTFAPDAVKELEQRPETCLDLTFMHGLLSLGYELGGERKVSIAKKLAGTELGWCLGAQLAVLEEEGLLCKAPAVAQR